MCYDSCRSAVTTLGLNGFRPTRSVDRLARSNSRTLKTEGSQTMKQLFKRVPQHLARLLALLLAIAPIMQARAVQVMAQSAAASASQEEDETEKVTFDTLLPASSYALYIEARDIGQHAHSGNFSEIIEPLAPMADQLPKEIDSLVKFVAANADTLTRSRLMIAFEPARPQLPPMLIALELASADVAQEFETKLHTLLSLFGSGSARAIKPSPSDSAESTSPPPASSSPFAIKRAGRVLAISAAPFTFKSLRGESDKRMSDDPNFRAAHNRFYAEPFFLYYDMALAARVTKERKETLTRYEEESKAGLVQVPPSSAIAEMETVTSSPDNEEDAVTAPETSDATASKQQAGTSDGSPSTSAASVVNVTATARIPAKAKPSRGRRAGQAAQPSKAAPSSTSAVPSSISVAPPLPPPPPEVTESRGPNLFDFLMRMVFASRSTIESQAEALGVALTLENDAIILRALMITPPGTLSSPIPFLARPISGSAQASEAANYLPADTDVFITASLDLSQLYELTLARAKENEKIMAVEFNGQNRPPTFESQIAAFEKANGFRVHDELLATLSNEIAVGLPASYLSETPLGRMPLKTQVAQTGPVFLIGVRNAGA
jgi:hypothetical protein